MRTVGQKAQPMLGLSYVLVVFLSRMPPKGFTRTDLCGMKGEVTGARILLSLFPSFPLIRAPALVIQTSGSEPRVGVHWVSQARQPSRPSHGGVPTARRVLGLHRLANHCEHIAAQGVQISLLAQPGTEGGERLGRVVLPPVEAPIYEGLDAMPQRVEQGRYDERRGYDG